MESKFALIKYSAHELAALLKGRSFSFGRTDGTVLAPDVRFADDGCILGYDHPNESTWTALDGWIEIKDIRGFTTSWFDAISFDGIGHTLLGSYGTQSSERIHILRENVANRFGFSSFVKPKQVSVDRPEALVAVLIRSHQCDGKFIDLYTKLLNSKNGFDLFAVVDETVRRPDVQVPNIIWHSEKSCRELGFTQRHWRLLHWCGDFPMYVAIREIPHYRYYIMIEDDVDFRCDDASFMEKIVGALTNSQTSYDLVGLNIRADPEGSWSKPCKSIFGIENTYYMTFPFVVCSKRLLCYLYSQRQIEAARGTSQSDIMNCEGFVPSAAVAGGFEFLDLNTLVPGSYGTTMMMHTGDYGFGRPIGFKPDLNLVGEMFHPVYTASEFVKRFKDRARSQPGYKAAVLESIISVARTLSIPNDLIEQLLEKEY